MPINENAAVKSAMSPYGIQTNWEVIADVVKVVVLLLFCCVISTLLDHTRQ
jgi:hypothetical protein